jgi:hypothetical protein
MPNQPNGVLQLTPASRPPLNRLRQQRHEKRPTFGAIATLAICPLNETLHRFPRRFSKRSGGFSHSLDSSDMSHPAAFTNRSVVLTSRRRLGSRAACYAGDILSQ